MERLVCALCNGLPLSNKYYLGKDEIRREKVVWGKANRLKIKETISIFKN